MKSLIAAPSLQFFKLLILLSGLCTAYFGTPLTAEADLSTTTETIIIQPGPAEGKDTYYGTTYKTGGLPNGSIMEIGGWSDWYYSFIEMDLDVLPTVGSQILKSELHLYSKTTTGVLNNGKLERITQPWTESGVTNSSNPTASSTGMSWQNVPFDSWWVVDTTDLTRDWVDGTYPNYGVKIFGQYNSGQRQRHFVTSDETTSTELRPKLVIDLLNYVPTVPTGLLTNSQTNPDELTSQPFFSAIYNDPDENDQSNAYRIQVDDDSDFSSPIWDSGQTAMSTTSEGIRSPAIPYNGDPLASSTAYYWNIKFWDDGEAEGAVSSETAVFTLGLATTTETIIIQPGPAEGKDTYYGTTYKTGGLPNGSVMEIGGWGDWYYSFIEFDLNNLPLSSSNIIESQLQIYNEGESSPNNGKLERITQPWTESGVTNSSNPTASSTGMSWQSVSDKAWWMVDVTDLTKNWIDGTYPNYGVKILGQYNSNHHQKHFVTSDEITSTELRPRLVTDIINYVPTTPNQLLTSSSSNPENLTSNPVFSAVYTDPDQGDKATSYRLQVDDDSDFSSPIWDSGQTAMATTSEGDRADIPYSGSPLASSTEYYWHIKFWDGSAEGSFSTESATFELN